MKFSNLLAAVAFGALLWSHGASAQPPTIANRWNVGSIYVGYHSSASACIYEAIGATNMWNAVGADFYFQAETTAYYSRVSQQTQSFDRKTITIEDADDVTLGAGAEARTLRTLDGTIVNSDIYLDRKRMNGTAGISQIACTSAPTIPANQIDGQTTISHELGHSLGFVHGAYTSCLMFYDLYAGEVKRTLCPDEKQEFIKVYGLPFLITSIPDVAGPQGIEIPARVFYSGSPVFPVKRETKNIECPSGWSCDNYTGSHASSTDSTFTFKFKCTPSTPLPTATFRWQTTLTDASGRITNTVQHASTCTRTAGAIPNQRFGERPDGINRAIITP